MNTQAEYMEQQLAEARARIAALEAEKARGVVPEGFVVVPVECTAAMELAYDDKCEADKEYEAGLHRPAYAAMLAVRPKLCLQCGQPTAASKWLCEAHCYEMPPAAPAPAERVEQGDDAGDLLPCPHCGSGVDFHKDEDCSGCHYIWCGDCNAFFDFSLGVDPGNKIELLDWLRAGCASMWNRRSPQPSPAPAAPDVAGLVEAASKVYSGLNDRIDAAIAERKPTPVFEGIAELHDALATFHREG